MGFALWVNRVAHLNFRIFDKPAVTIADVALQAKAWAIDGGLDFIVVDYLTRVKPVKSSGNQTLDVGEVATGLKNIARQINIPVMALAQLNRASTKRTDKRPNMADLRDSGVIEQEADQILLLHRDDEDDNAPAEVIVDKNRHGEVAIRIRKVRRSACLGGVTLITPNRHCIKTGKIS
ncbi:DnaB-like helicase C-terminal domain-containing protein [Methylomonas montana]|uniref:DnaB-like helicase C-terminal domain-containing protein n=1 Tax=Methylomonas montana TaxID=3058963 RepID=UPI002659D542|nr:DnaB-like helicase C-terminal domain-containing protein [Methylomonas montana]WKJ91343.1 DnaB-like helicase C-terminal domain-containing protein [Methylomonas montana]